MTTATRPTALWVCPVSELAGVGRHIIDVARVGLPEHRLVLTAPEGPLLERVRALDVPVLPLPTDTTPAAVRALRTTVRRLRPAVVHSHLAKADFLATAACAGLPSTLISTEHHVPQDLLVLHGSRPKAAGRQVAHHLRIRRFAHLIAVSRSTERDMRRHWRPTAPITVIHNGIDPQPQRPARPTGLRILSLTRLSPEKNLTMTLRVFAHLAAQHPQARLTIGGSGPEAARLQQLAAELGVADAVTFAGFVDPERAMAEHDVLMQPSRTDNFSYALLDAVNTGMGVVASDIGGNPEILPAHCLAPLDDVPAMAVAVLEQGQRPARRPTLPADVPSVVEMVEQITRVYREAVRCT